MKANFGEGAEEIQAEHRFKAQARHNVADVSLDLRQHVASHVHLVDAHRPGG